MTAIISCVFDAGPETRKVVEFQETKENGIVWLCSYPTMSIEKKIDGILLDQENYLVKVDRTQSLDKLVASYRTQQTILPTNAASIPDFYKQMTASQRVHDENRNEYVWVHTTPDDYFHASNYDLRAWEVFGEFSPLTGFGSAVEAVTGWI